MRRLVSAALVVTVGVVSLRRWFLGWDATAEERTRNWPMDDRILDPSVVTTRAITAAAVPGDVWPWLAQMGESPRGGFYSYTSVERLLGMRVQNAGRVLPEWQHPVVGEALDRAGNMVVLGIEEGSWLVLGPPPGTPLGQSTWLLMAVPVESGVRIVSRVRIRFGNGGLKGLAFAAILRPGQFIMERKMLLELRRRAEGTHRERAEGSEGAEPEA